MPLEQASASAMPDGITDPNYHPLPGRVGNLTVPQQHALQTLKTQLQDEGHFVPERMDDAMLLRYVTLCVFWGIYRCAMCVANPRLMSDGWCACC